MLPFSPSPHGASSQDRSTDQPWNQTGKGRPVNRGPLTASLLHNNPARQARSKVAQHESGPDQEEPCCPCGVIVSSSTQTGFLGLRGGRPWTHQKARALRPPPPLAEGHFGERTPFALSGKGGTTVLSHAGAERTHNTRKHTHTQGLVGLGLPGPFPVVDLALFHSSIYLHSLGRGGVEGPVPLPRHSFQLSPPPPSQPAASAFPRLQKERPKAPMFP